MWGRQRRSERRAAAQRAADADELAQLLDEVRRIEAMTRTLVADVMVGAYTSSFRGAGLEFDTLRAYVPGDDPRAVDWHVTARMGRPYVKTYVDERDVRLRLVLDTGVHMETGLGVWTLRQLAARVVACLAVSASRAGDRFGLVTYGGPMCGLVPQAVGAPHALRVVRRSLRRSAPGTEAPTTVEDALRIVDQARRRGSLVVLVSDFIASGWEDALARCARKHDVVAIRLSLGEPSLPARGVVALRDPASGLCLSVDAGHGPTRDAWERTVVAEEAAIDSALRRAGASVIVMPLPRTADLRAVARPLLRFFESRRRQA